MYANSRRCEGVALLLVLVFIVLLSAIVLEFMYETRVEASLVGNQMDGLQARVAAQSAVASGMALLESDLQASEEQQLPPYDSLFDVWAEGIPYQEINDGVMQCTISDEYGKLGLNALIRNVDEQLPEGESQTPAQPETPAEAQPVGEERENQTLIEALRQLLLARGAEEDPTDAILDWIDSDDEPRPMGAEDDYYLSLESPYSCKNGYFDSVEELLLVKGVTPELFFGDIEAGQLSLLELLTVRGHNRGRINVNTAPLEVLDAVGEALVQSGLGQMIATERESNPFQSVDELAARGIVITPQPENPSPQMFLVGSRVFRIRGDGMAGEAMCRIEAYVRRSGQSGQNAQGNVRLLDWREIE